MFACSCFVFRCVSEFGSSVFWYVCVFAYLHLCVGLHCCVAGGLYACVSDVFDSCICV